MSLPMLARTAASERGSTFTSGMMVGYMLGMADKPTFEATVRNLLRMKPKPHDEDSGDKAGQSDSRSDQSSSKRATKLRNSGED